MVRKRPIAAGELHLERPAGSAASLVYRGSNQGMRAVKYVTIAQVLGVSDHDFSAVPIILGQLQSRMNMEDDAPRYFGPVERHADR